MAKYTPEKIRNFCFCGHGGVGKTILAESILHSLKITNRFGSVEDGTTVSDFDEEEKNRKISINSSIINFEYKGTQFNLIDTPGYADFVAELLYTLEVVENVCICIDAVNGIQVNTRKTWEYVKEKKKPTMIIITKTEAENADYNKVLDSIKEYFGTQVVPILVPDISGPSFSKVINLLSDNVPSELEEIKNQTIESIVESDDELMEKYLEEGSVSIEELKGIIKKGIIEGNIIPLFALSGAKEIGVKEFIDFMIEFGIAPTDIKYKALDKDNNEIELEAKEDAPLSCFIFKIRSDKFVGKIGYFRVFSGKISSGSTAVVSTTGKAEKFPQLFKIFGAKQIETSEAVPGEIVAVSKVEALKIGESIYSGNQVVKFPPVKLPTPMVSLAVEPKSKGDEQRISNALRRLADEDPTFIVNREQQTNELVITGMGNLHLDIALSKMKKRYEVEVNTKPPKIPYKETITGFAEAKYRHKKQTGGHGQFAEVVIKLEPLERGKGFEFSDEIVGGVIPSQFIPAVEKGIRETMKMGILAGYPIDDLRVRLVDGMFHEVDSSEASFKIASSKAFQDAFMRAKPVLLEPIVNIEVVVPISKMGDITGDISGRRGKILGMDSMGEMQVIKAQVPLAEITNYATELRSITGGEGYFSMEFSHYDIVPSNIAQTIIERSKREKEEAQK